MPRFPQLPIYVAVAASIGFVAPAQRSFAQEAIANAARQQAEAVASAHPASQVNTDGMTMASESATTTPTSQSQPQASAIVNPDGMALPQGPSAAELEADGDLGEQWVLRKNERTLRF